MISDIRNRVDISWTHILLIFLRFVQFALALTVVGLYGVDLNRARKEKKYVDSKWLYAEIVGSISAAVSLFYMIPFRWVMDLPFSFVADAVLFVLWIAVFGIFGKLYIGQDPQGDAGQIRMQHALWVDLTNALLWLLTAAIMALYWMRNRQTRTRFTGRARV